MTIGNPGFGKGGPYHCLDDAPGLTVALPVSGSPSPAGTTRQPAVNQAPALPGGQPTQEMTWPHPPAKEPTCRQADLR